MSRFKLHRILAGTGPPRLKERIRSPGLWMLEKRRRRVRETQRLGGRGRYTWKPAERERPTDPDWENHRLCERDPERQSERGPSALLCAQSALMGSALWIQSLGSKQGGSWPTQDTPKCCQACH